MKLLLEPIYYAAVRGRDDVEGAVNVDLLYSSMVKFCQKKCSE